MVVRLSLVLVLLAVAVWASVQAAASAGQREQLAGALEALEPETAVEADVVGTGGVHGQPTAVVRVHPQPGAPVAQTLDGEAVPIEAVVFLGRRQVAVGDGLTIVVARTGFLVVSAEDAEIAREGLRRRSLALAAVAAICAGSGVALLVAVVRRWDGPALQVPTVRRHGGA
jgi:hypothetical protein